MDKGRLVLHLQCLVYELDIALGSEKALMLFVHLACCFQSFRNIKGHRVTGTLLEKSTTPSPKKVVWGSPKVKLKPN